MFKRWVILVIFLALMMTPVYAQDGTTADSPENLSMSEGGNVSLDFRDADIQNVLRILSYKSGVNIVAGPEVTGLITIKLQDVPWQKALQVVLETYGYAYEQRGNIITVTTIDNLKKRREDAKLLADQEPLVTKTYVLNYAKAADVKASIDKMKTDRGSINMDERTNAVIVRDIPGNLELISAVIDQLDKTTPQVLIEAKIVETTLSNTDKLGIDWVANASITGSARPHMWPFTVDTSNKYSPYNFPAIGASDEGFQPDTVSSGFTLGTLSFAEA